MHTVSDIAKFRNCSTNTVNGWIKQSKAKPDFVDYKKIRFFSTESANKIMSFSPQYHRPFKYQKCVDMHLQDFNIKEIAQQCELCTVTSRKIIKEFKNSGEITLESKLNFIL